MTEILKIIDLYFVYHLLAGMIFGAGAARAWMGHTPRMAIQGFVIMLISIYMLAAFASSAAVP